MSSDFSDDALSCSMSSSNNSNCSCAEGVSSSSGEDEEPIRSWCRCNRRCLRGEKLYALSKTRAMFVAQPSKFAQDMFLQRLISCHRPKDVSRRMTQHQLKTRSKSQRHQFKSTMFFYHVPCGRHRYAKACGVAFRTVYGVSRKRVDRLCRLRRQRKKPQDMRGKHPLSRYRVPRWAVQQVDSFIQHYPRDDDKKTTVTRMYAKFVKQHADGAKVVNYQYFLKYLKMIANSVDLDSSTSSSGEEEDVDSNDSSEIGLGKSEKGYYSKTEQEETVLEHCKSNSRATVATTRSPDSSMCQEGNDSDVHENETGNYQLE